MQRHKEKAASYLQTRDYHQTLNLPIPWPWTPLPPELGEINVNCLSHTVFGILWEQPKLTEAMGIHIPQLTYPFYCQWSFGTIMKSMASDHLKCMLFSWIISLGMEMLGHTACVFSALVLTAKHFFRAYQSTLPAIIPVAPYSCHNLMLSAFLILAILVGV